MGSHRMRTVTNYEHLAGRPVMICSASEPFGGYELGCPIFKALCLEPSPFGCSTKFFSFAFLITHKNNSQMSDSIGNFF